MFQGGAEQSRQCGETGSRTAHPASVVPHVKAVAIGGRSPMAFGERRQDTLLPAELGASHCTAHAHHTPHEVAPIFNLPLGKWRLGKRSEPPEAMGW